MTAPSGPLNILKVNYWFHALLQAIVSIACLATCSLHTCNVIMAVTKLGTSFFTTARQICVWSKLENFFVWLQADWFAKHRQQRPAVAAVFFERCGS